jgi:hypothetical protein
VDNGLGGQNLIYKLLEHVLLGLLASLLDLGQLGLGGLFGLGLSLGVAAAVGVLGLRKVLLLLLLVGLNVGSSVRLGVLELLCSVCVSTCTGGVWRQNRLIRAYTHILVPSAQSRGPSSLPGAASGFPWSFGRTVLAGSWIVRELSGWYVGVWLGGGVFGSVPNGIAPESVCVQDTNSALDSIDSLLRPVSLVYRRHVNMLVQTTTTQPRDLQSNWQVVADALSVIALL